MILIPDDDIRQTRWKIVLRSGQELLWGACLFPAKFFSSLINKLNYILGPSIPQFFHLAFILELVTLVGVYGEKIVHFWLKAWNFAHIFSNLIGKK